MSKSRNLREEMLNKTAGLRSTSEVVPDKNAPPRLPRTAVGQLGELSIAKQRIQELEELVARAGPGTKLKLTSLIPGKYQPRRAFDEAAVRELAENLKENGLLQLIVVRMHPTRPDRFEIIMGERRVRAAKLLGWDEIDGVVVEYSDVKAAIAALSENIQREDLCDFEISQGIADIEKEFPKRKDLAEAIGISRTQLFRLAAFQKLPDFVVADLNELPSLLGATAAGDVVSMLKRHGDRGMEVFRELWSKLKGGAIDQMRLAAAIDAGVDQRKSSTVSAGGHVRTFFRDGSKAADIRRDGRHLTIRVRNVVVDEQMEKRIKEFMDTLFPTD